MTNAKGIDVSSWQETTPSLAGLDFIFARATDGLNHDTRYAMHIANGKHAGLVTGAYHFAYGFLSIATQVTTFLAFAGDVDLYVIDVEGPNAPSHAQVAEFIARMHAAGKRCGIYHSLNNWFDAGQDFRWVADWNGQPGIPWDFWQTHGSPDPDWFHGTAAELRAFASGTTAGPETAQGERMIAAGGLHITSDHVVTVTQDTPILSDLAGTLLGATAKAGYTYDYIGAPDGTHLAVLVDTALPYPDKLSRPTILYIASAAGKITAKPAVPDPLQAALDKANADLAAAQAALSPAQSAAADAAAFVAAAKKLGL